MARGEGIRRHSDRRDSSNRFGARGAAGRHGLGRGRQVCRRPTCRRRGQWERDRRDKDQELAELVADLDRIAVEKGQAIADLTAQLEAAATRLEGAEKNAGEAVEAAERARGENNNLKTELSAAEARTATLQQTIDALLQRITPVTEENEGMGP